MLKSFMLLLYIMTFPLEDHDIHVSICDIEVHQEKVEITVKTFIDDLQIAVGLTPGEEVPDNYTSANEMITSYIENSMILSLSKEDVHLEITDISASNDAVWITLSANNVTPMTGTLSFSSSFLTEIYDDQTNIVNIKIADEKKTFSLNKKTKNITHDFSN